MTLSGATTPGQSGPANDGNEGVFRIPKSSSITGTSPSDCLVPYPGQSLGGGSYPSAEKQSMAWAKDSLNNFEKHLFIDFSPSCTFSHISGMNACKYSYLEA